MFAHLNATTTLSRAISEKGIYPAVDPLDSTSTILKPDIVGEEHYDVANEVKEVAPALQGAAGHHRDPRHRRALRRGQGRGAARAQDRALPSQPFHVAEQFTGTPGAYVPIAETVRGFKEILEGKHDDLPERAFLLKGTIDDVVEAATGRARGRRGRGRAEARLTGDEVRRGTTAATRAMAARVPVRS